MMQGLLNEDMGGAAVEQVDSESHRRRIMTTLNNIFDKSRLETDVHLLIGHVVSDSQAGDPAAEMVDVHVTKLCALIKYWILQRCSRNPMLMVFDDAQWLDPSSWKLCEELLDGGSNDLVMIFSTRPLDEGGFWKQGKLKEWTDFLGRQNSPHIILPPMPKGDIKDVVAHHLQKYMHETQDDYDFVKCAVHVGNLGGIFAEENKLTELLSQHIQSKVYAVTVRHRTGETSWAVVHFAKPSAVEKALKFKFKAGSQELKFRTVNEEQAMVSTGAFSTVWASQKDKVRRARFSDDHSSDIIRSALESQGSNADVEKALKECATGNPLCAIMVAESVVEKYSTDWHADGQSDVFQSSGSGSPTPPRSPSRSKSKQRSEYQGADQELVKAVRTMLGNLSQNEKELVKRAAVAGGGCSVDFLETLQTEVEGVTFEGVVNIDTVETVHSLLGKKLLLPDQTLTVANDGLPPLYFRARLIQEVAASPIGLVENAERSSIHVAVAQLYRDGKFNNDELTAYHYGEAGPQYANKRILHLELCANRALKMHADQEAEYLFSKLLEPGQDDVTDDVLAQWTASFVKARIRVGRGHTAKHHCQHALSLLDMPVPSSPKQRTDISLQILLGSDHLPEQAQEMEYRVLAELHHLLSQIALEQNDSFTYTYSCLRSLQFARSQSSVLLPFDVARGFALVAAAACHMDRPDLAETCYREALELVQSHSVWKHPKNKRELIVVRALLAESLMVRGAWKDAQEEWEIIAQLAKDEGDETVIELSQYQCGWTAMYTKGINSAYPWFLTATKSAEHRYDLRRLAMLLCAQALCEIHSHSHTTADEALTMADGFVANMRFVARKAGEIDASHSVLSGALPRDHVMFEPETRVRVIYHSLPAATR
jgi:hypothetical protein